MIIIPHDMALHRNESTFDRIIAGFLKFARNCYGWRTGERLAFR